VNVESDADSALKEIFVKPAAQAATQKIEGKEIDKQKNYRALPPALRQRAIVRNFDNASDIIIYVAIERGRKVTRSIVTGVRDFLCPLYPFCSS
jgi:hypothetical protein